MNANSHLLQRLKRIATSRQFRVTAWNRRKPSFSARPLRKTGDGRQSPSAIRTRVPMLCMAIRNKLQPIHHTLGPLSLRDQVFLSVWLLVQPWRYRRGSARLALRGLLEEEYGMHCTLFSSGREALLAILKTFDLQPGEEVILQSYTCGVLANAIHAAGGVPIYVDTAPNSLNMDPKRVEEAMSPRVRAVICQHTFGVPADLPSLREICDRHACALIEDCAHCLPCSAKSGSLTGHTGDFVLLSFGRDKAVSGVTGGAALTPHAYSHRALQHLEQSASELPLFTIARLLLYPLIMTVARPLYGLRLGRVFLAILRKARILLPVITNAEKRGQGNPGLSLLPNACAALVLRQFQNLTYLERHRSAIVSMYQIAFPPTSFRQPDLPAGHPPLIRFPLLLTSEDPRLQQSLFSSGPDRLRDELAKLNIHLSDGWHDAVVLPPSFDQSRTGYRAASCPNAELLARSILNLPTHPLMGRAQAQRLIHVLKEKLAPAAPVISPGEAVQERKPSRRRNVPALSLH